MSQKKTSRITLFLLFSLCILSIFTLAGSVQKVKVVSIDNNFQASSSLYVEGKWGENIVSVEEPYELISYNVTDIMTDVTYNDPELGDYTVNEYSGTTNIRFRIGFQEGFNKSGFKDNDTIIYLKAPRPSITNIGNITSNIPLALLKDGLQKTTTAETILVSTNITYAKIQNNWDSIKDQNFWFDMDLEFSDRSSFQVGIGTGSTVTNFTWETGHLENNTVFDTFVYEKDFADNTTSSWYLFNNHTYAEDLVVLYHFNNDTLSDTLPDLYRDNASQAYDYSLGQNNGTISGANWNITDKHIGDASLSFDATDDFVNISGVNIFSGGDASMCAWVYYGDNGENNPYLFVTDTALVFGFSAHANSGQLWFNRGTSIESSAFANNVWTHYCVTANSAGTGWIYINGVEDVTGAVGTDANRGYADSTIGNTPEQDRTWDGNIDEIAFWNRTLTAEEIYNIYSRQRGGNTDQEIKTTWNRISGDGPVGFPNISYLATHKTGLDIIDADSGDLWMRFSEGTGRAFNTSSFNSVTAKDSSIYVGSDDGLYDIDFEKDTITMFGVGGNANFTKGDNSTAQNISKRNTELYYGPFSGTNIINRGINAIEVNNDSLTEFIVVGTDGGITVINKTDFSSYDSTFTEQINVVELNTSAIFYANNTDLGRILNIQSLTDGFSYSDYLSIQDIQDIEVNETDIFCATSTGVSQISQNTLTQAELELGVDNSLILLTHLNDGVANGTTAVDSSVLSGDGTLYGGASWNTSIKKLGDYALTFDGVDDMVNFTDIDDLDGASQASFVFWVYPTARSDYDGFIQKYQDGNNRVTVQMGGAAQGGNDDVIFVVANAAGAQAQYTNEGVMTPLNSWIHLAFVYDGTQATNTDRVKIYKNGNLIADTTTGAMFTTLPTTSNIVTFGNDVHATGREFNGNLDEVAIWNRSLSAKEIYAIYTLSNKYCSSEGPCEYPILSGNVSNTTAIALNGSNLYVGTYGTNGAISQLDLSSNSLINNWSAGPGNVSLNTNFTTSLSFYGNNTGSWWLLAGQDGGLSAILQGFSISVSGDVTGPKVTNVWPADTESFTFKNINLTYNVTDVSSVSSCSLYIEDVFNSTDLSIPKEQNQTFNLTFAEGTYNWHVDCVDAESNNASSSETSFTVDVPDLNVVNITIKPDFPLDTDTLNCSATYLGSLDKANLSFMFFKDNVPQNFNASALNVDNATIGEANQVLNNLNFSDGSEYICSVKARNGAFESEWVNSTIKNVYTCGIGSDSLTIIFFLVFLMCLFSYLSMFHFKEYWPFRIFLFLLAVGMVSLILFTSLQIVEQQAPTSKCQEDVTIYAEVHFHNDSATGVVTTIHTQSIWHNVTGFNQSVDSMQTLQGFAWDPALEQVRALFPGLYKVDYSLSIGNAGNNQEIISALAVNQLPMNNTETHRKIGASGDVGNTGGVGIMELKVNDNVSLMAKNEDGTANLEVHAASYTLWRIDT